MFFNNLLGLNITTFFMLFHRQHDHIISLGSWVTGYPLQCLCNELWIFLITWNDKTVDDFGNNIQSLILWLYCLLWLLEGWECSFENHSHVEVKVQHFKEHAYPSKSTVVLIVDREEYGSSDDKDPIDDVDWRNKVFELLIAIKVGDIHCSTSYYIF